MDIVVDTNIIIASMLREGLTRNLLFRPDLRLFSPDFMNEELANNSEELMQKSCLVYEEYRAAEDLVCSKITSISSEEYVIFEAEARRISPDMKDWPFFAAALYLNCPIWSNEKRLKRQETTKVYVTTELFDFLSRR